MRACTCTILAILLVLAAPGPADGQSWKGPTGSENRDELVVVQEFSPKSGGVGDEVTIEGRGFNQRTRILVGGRPVKPVRVRSTALVFRMPEQYGDGMIVLRHPGVARDIEVGRFRVAASVQITRFAPQSGIRGTRVEIQGAGFSEGVRVLMNGKELEINRLAPKRLVVTIAQDATTDYLVVAKGQGEEVRTDEMFRVNLPAPTIDSLTPEAGLPGMTVRISGKYFTAEDRVLYGKHQLAITARGSGYVEVKIPSEERVPRVIEIVNANGRGRSAHAFRLEKPPVLKRVVPTSGKPGTSLVIHGSGFRAGDRVMLSETALEIVELRATRISALLPADCSSGALVVERGTARIESRQRFEVIRMPVIKSFEPRGGKPGGRVTIIGEHFTRDAVVYYGAKKLKIVRRRGAEALVVNLPGKIEEDVFRVQTRGGEARSAQMFQIHRPPEVAALTPTSGVPGTQVTVAGKNLGSIDALLLGQSRLEILTRESGRLVVRIPVGAKTGRVAFESFGKSKISKFRFEVLPGPDIRIFTPRSAPPGAELVIEGDNLHAETELFLGDNQLEILRRTSDRIVARIPVRMKSGQYVVMARAGSSESRAADKLSVIEPAVITGFAPERAEAGSQVVIRGRNFDMNTKVYWGDVLLSIVSIDKRGEKMVVNIPERTMGARYLEVDSGGVRGQARSMLEVVTPRPHPKKGKDRKR